MEVKKEVFEFAIQKIKDGFIFESFASDFLTGILGYDFIPVGRTKDKGVDAFLHIFSRKDSLKIIFQMSTELGHEGKIYNTIKKLDVNDIKYDRLVYVTNRNINNSEKLVDEFYEKTAKQLTVYDIKWFTANCNANEGTIKAYRLFVDTYLHEYSKPGTYVSVENLDKDSRLYVFLSQQFESNRTNLKLDNLLVDTLIMYALEGTDPDKNIFKTDSEIKKSIEKYIKFDAHLIENKIAERLTKLTTKPRKIKFHSVGKGYCLPFETRSEIERL